MTAGKPLALTPTRLSAGIWEGILTSSAKAPPVIEALHDGAVLAQAEVSPLPGQSGQWVVRLAIPAAILNDGVQTLLLQSDGEVDRKSVV